MKLISAFGKSPDTRKRRFGRVQPPRNGDRTSTRPSRPTDAVDEFVNLLCELPLADWLVIGHALIADRVGAAARVVAFARLQGAIAAFRMQLEAWHVRDSVDTAAFTAASGITSWTRANRRAFAATHAAAEDAGLALLVGDALSAEDRRLLAAPFAARVSS
jgi:hypothetical protein